jgi:flagellar hook-length control protein FliK
MTTALALSLQPAGIPSMPMAGRALPEFNLALATAPAPVSTPVSIPVAAAAVPEGATELAVHSAPAMVTPAEIITATPTAAARIPACVAQLLAGDEATDQTVSNQMPVASAMPRNVARLRMADVAARKAALPEPQSAQAALPDEKMIAVAADPDVLPTDNDKTDKDTEAASPKDVVVQPDDVRAPVPAISTPPVIIPPLAEKAPAPASLRAVSTRPGAEGRKIGAAVAATRSPAKLLAANVGLQTANVQATDFSEDEAATKTVPPLATEQHAKSTAFEAALGFSTMASPSSDSRNVVVPPAYGLHELSGAQGVADRHLNLARDTMWLDQLATDIVSAADRTDHISFRLVPAHLGQLDIDLVTGDAGLSVNIATSTDEAGKIVASAQPGLVESLQAQGIRVADTQVTSGNDMSRHNQPQRQYAAHHLIETAFSGADEPADPNDERPDGRFA